MQANGLAMAAGITDLVNLVMLAALLRRKVGRIDGTRIARSLAKVAVASAVMGVAAYYIRNQLHPQLGAGFFGALAEFGIVSTAATAIYLLIVHLMKAEELGYVVGIVTRRMGRR
jgi:putative peptidoglycan lipid II flippase